MVVRRPLDNTRHAASRLQDGYTKNIRHVAVKPFVPACGCLTVSPQHLASSPQCLDQSRPMANRRAAETEHKPEAGLCRHSPPPERGSSRADRRLDARCDLSSGSGPWSPDRLPGGFGRRLNLTSGQFTVLIGVAYRQGDNEVRCAARRPASVWRRPCDDRGRTIDPGRDCLRKEEPNSKDKRSVLIMLSAKGEAAVRKVALSCRP